jgi:uncharacterized membrane protein (DUF2068 family)
MTDLSLHTADAPNVRKHHTGLLLIAAYKLLGALLFILVGVGALKLVHKDIGDFTWHALVEVLHRNPESRVVNFFLEKAELLNDPLLKRIGFGAFAYAALGILEAIGLYLEKAWGEFLTVLITASFLPIEIHELAMKVDAWRIGILAANTAVLVYLLYLLWERAAHRARQKRAAATPAEPEPEPEHSAAGHPGHGSL